MYTVFFNFLNYFMRTGFVLINGFMARKKFRDHYAELPLISVDCNVI